MDAGCFGGCNVGRLPVEQKVGKRRPNERSAHVRHLGEFLVREGHAVNQHQFTDQEVVLNEDVKLRSAAFVNTFSDVDEPSVEFTAGVAGFDVVADVIGGQLRDLGVDFVPAEIVVLDVP